SAAELPKKPFNDDQDETESQMTFALAMGVGTQNQNGQWLEVYYPKPILAPDTALITEVQKALNYQGGNSAIAVTKAQMQTLSVKLIGEHSTLAASLGRSDRPLVVTILETVAKPSSTPEVYLKLH